MPDDPKRGLRDGAPARCPRWRPGCSNRSATPSPTSSGAWAELVGSSEVSTARKWSPKPIVVTPCRRESGGMISSHAATMRRHQERRLLRLYHGDADAGAREELVHCFREDLYQSEVAERVGVSTTHVARLLRRSIEALHETNARHSTSRVAATTPAQPGPAA